MVVVWRTVARGDLAPRCASWWIGFPTQTTSSSFSIRRVTLSTKASLPKPPTSPFQRVVSADQIKRFQPIASQFLLHPAQNATWQVVQPHHFSLVNIPHEWDTALAVLQQRLGIQFHDVLHLKCALIHHGALGHTPAVATALACRLSNRSLEFLGDSLLGFAASSYLFQSCPLFQEGQLTLAKSAIVNNITLSRICREVLQIHELILVAPDVQLATESPGRRTIEAGTVEALIGALYLDQGVKSALKFVNDQILPHAVRFASHNRQLDAVSAFQRLVHSLGFPNPEFRKIPPSAKSQSTIEVVVGSTVLLHRRGSSYRKAKKKAAQAALNLFATLLADETTKSLKGTEFLLKAVDAAASNQLNAADKVS